MARADKTPSAKTAPPAKTAPAAAPEPAPKAPSPAPETPQETKQVRDDDPVVVDPGVEDAYAPTTLAEASRAERARRASAGASTVVINDKNLHTFSKGQVTVTGPKEADKQEAAAAPPPTDGRDEQYWRSRARDIRERWRQAAEDVKKLEQKSTELRQKFYLENDTFKRDNQIKPDWDRVLDKLRQSRLDVDEAQEELAEFLEEGRVEDVMPGWLREGEDEEPEPTPKKQDSTPLGQPVQSIEPPVIEPPAAEPPAREGPWGRRSS